MILTFSQLGNNGRLGNQMFQYATLRALGIKLNIPIKIPRGNYDLLKFDINKDFIDNNVIEYKYNERYFHFSEDIFNIKPNTDIFGYFQSYKYFYFIRDILIREFNSCYLTTLCDNVILDIKQKYDNRRITAIHVRRGDYLNYPTIHPVCTKKYYKKCMECFDDNLFLVFSDDINWCKSNIDFNNKYVEYNNNDSVIDLLLMSKCDNNIISNSSFSWWSAWLNNNDNKIVKYPNIWFGNQGPQDVYDLIPKDWSQEEC